MVIHQTEAEQMNMKTLITCLAYTNESFVKSIHSIGCQTITLKVMEISFELQMLKY